METFKQHPRVRYMLVTTASMLCLPFATTATGQTAFLPPAGQEQCQASDINDNLGIVGDCVPSNGNGPRVATYASAPGGAQSILQALTAGQPCTATGLPNSGTAVGSCENASGTTEGVIWPTPASMPITLSPLPALKGSVLQLVADVASTPMAYNQNGDVVGASATSDEVDTAVLWPTGTGSASAMVVVSSYRDNCEAADVNGTYVNGRPTVALNCPASLSAGAPGTLVGKVAINDALGGYQLYPLPTPTSATHCEVVGINDALQFVGTCYFSGAGNPQTAYWPNRTSAPQLLVATGNARNTGRFINAAGKIAFDYQTTNGEMESGFWDPATNVKAYVADPPGSSRCQAVGLGDNDDMALNCENASEHVQAAKWTPAAGTVPLGNLDGGMTGAITALNKSGTAAAFSGQDSAEIEVAGEVGF